jgi:hypothetical protein
VNSPVPREEWITMKTTFHPAAIGLALAAASLLVVVAPASAATPGATFITTADIATPGSFGTTGWSNTGPGTFTDTPLNGLVGNANVRPYFGFSSNVSLATGTALRDIGDATTFHVSNDVDITAEIRWYAGAGDTGEQYLYADAGGSGSFTDPAALWHSTTDVGSISPFSFGTLAQFDAQFAADGSLADASVQGVGVYNQGAPLINFYSFIADGNVFYFTPEPVSTAPTSVTQTDFGTAGRGVTATTTGFVPGETVSTYLSTTQSVSDPIDLIADADGAVSYTWVAPVTNMDLGEYSILFVGAASGVEQLFSFEVIADAALAATGSQVELPLIAGGTLLLGGVALAVVAAVRRRTV